jgi:putative membrane protein
MWIQRSRIRRKKTNLIKGVAAGLASGLIASWTMNQYQKIWSAFQEKDGQLTEAEKQRQLDQNVTVKVADSLSRRFLHRTLQPSEKASAGNLVHYGFGMITGGLYGFAADRSPLFRKALGIPWGTFVWLQADELALPALGLSKPMKAYPISVHLYALTSHFVFGATMEITRRLIRKLL